MSSYVVSHLTDGRWRKCYHPPLPFCTEFRLIQHIFVLLQVQQPKVTSVLTEPQRALISTISEGQKAVQQAEQILETKLEVPDLGTDPVSGPHVPPMHLAGFSDDSIVLIALF